VAVAAHDGPVGAQRGSGSRAALFVVTAAAVLVVDVVTKSVAVGVLTPGERVWVFGDAVSCLLIRNSGAALSWGESQPALLTLLVGVVVCAIAWRGSSVVSPVAAVGLGLVLGGALGNLADRVFRAPGPLRGAVVDFISVGWSPTFNAADVCVLVGVVTLGWLVLTATAAPVAERVWSADDAF
jgi:signal peptidase II